MTKRITDLAKDAIGEHVNLLVPWYLMASYLYYVDDTALVTDEFYDEICHRLLYALDNLEIDHPHMHLCDPVALRAGTAYHLKPSDYPLITQNTAFSILRKYTD